MQFIKFFESMESAMESAQTKADLAFADSSADPTNTIAHIALQAAIAERNNMQEYVGSRIKSDRDHLSTILRYN